MTPRLLLACAAASGLLLAAVLSACNQGGSVTPPDCSASASSQSAEAARGVIVRYRTEGAALRAQSLAAQGGAAVSGAGQTLLVSTPDVTGTVARLSQNPDVLYAVPNAVLHKADTGAAESPVVPTDQYASLQWAYPLLGYGAVWRDMQDSPYTHPVTVAVLDSGVRYDHPDLAGALYQPGEGALDVLSRCSNGNTQGSPNGDGDGPDTDPTDPATPSRTSDDISHGTHVTGIIAARWGTFTPPCDTCSTSGVVGATYTAPVKILPVRVLDAQSGTGDENSISLAIRYAAGETVTLEGRTYTNPHPAQVINLSLGGPISAEGAQPLCEAVAAAAARGALVVAAGGNDGATAPYYPAACDGAVAVAAVILKSASEFEHAFYSNSYNQIALSAPGGNGDPTRKTFYNGGQLNGDPFPDTIISTGWDFKTNRPIYATEYGTSQATPQVSALAALLLSKGVTTDPASTLRRMEDTATHLGSAGRNPDYGYGVINAAAALNAPAVTATP